MLSCNSPARAAGRRNHEGTDLVCNSQIHLGITEGRNGWVQHQNESCFLPYSSAFCWYYLCLGADGQGWTVKGTGVSELMEGC